MQNGVRKGKSIEREGQTIFLKNRNQIGEEDPPQQYQQLMRKINIGGMRIRRKKERKAHEMSRGKVSDFEKIEGEGILRVRNENKVRQGKIKI